jgi:hypothetical protein
VSRRAIAAALALEDVVAGERLVAFSLAGFANREQLAWPGTASAAARAGLTRSRYLQARGRLLSRGLIEMHEEGGERGRSTTVLLGFADGAQVEGPINAELFESVLGYSRSSGPARLLLASIAALADEYRELDGVSADELCAAAGLAARTYRRARNALIASGELELVRGLGGRGRANCWRIADLRVVGWAATSRRPRRSPSGPARPLMVRVAPSVADIQPATAGETTRETKSQHTALDRATSTVEGCQVRTVFAVKGGQDRTVSALKGGQDRTVSLETRPQRGPKRAPQRQRAPERGTQRGPERGPPNARAWKEPENHGTREHPPNPPQGELDNGELFLEQSHITDRGRKRKQLVRIDVDALRRHLTPASPTQHQAWLSARALLLRTVGESTFEIWLAPIELAAVARDGSLVLNGPEATASWVRTRFGRLISECCEASGCRVRFASPQERVVIEHRLQAAVSAVVGEQATMNRRVS